MSDAFRKAVTANRLADGAVVYLTASGGWSAEIDDCRVAADEGEAASMLALGEEAAARQFVVGPYLFDLAGDDGALRPARLREAIRARGPTTGSSLRFHAAG
jgi:hypothetical protein